MRFKLEKVQTYLAKTNLAKPTKKFKKVAKHCVDLRLLQKLSTYAAVLLIFVMGLVARSSSFGGPFEFLTKRSRPQEVKSIKTKFLQKQTPARVALAECQRKAEEQKRALVSRYGARGSGITVSDALTAEQIDNFLNRYGSPLAGKGCLLVETGKKYGVNPAVVVAISGAESTFGRHAPGYNAWGWGHKRWSSWEEAIDSFTHELRIKYIDGWRCETIDDLNRRYNSHSTWSRGVKYFYTELMNTN